MTSHGSNLLINSLRFVISHIFKYLSYPDLRRFDIATMFSSAHSDILSYLKTHNVSHLHAVGQGQKSLNWVLHRKLRVTGLHLTSISDCLISRLRFKWIQGIKLNLGQYNYDPEVGSIISKAVNLKVLDLQLTPATPVVNPSRLGQGLYSICDWTFKKIKNCSMLICLIIKGAKVFSDSSIQVISQHCPKILKLGLIDCESMTNVGLQFISSFKDLNNFSIVRNNKIESEGILVILRKCLKITSLSVEGCSQLDGNCVRGAAHILPLLEYFTIYDSR